MTATAAEASAGTALPLSTPEAPPALGPQPTYIHSSQARSWRFSAEQLATMRRDGNAGAAQRIDALWKRERGLTAVDGEPEASSSTSPTEYLNVDEEQALIAYYLSRVRQLVKAFGLPELVEATTLTYIKRFYLRNTCMDYHPKNIMLTCLFLAAKAESNVVPLRTFATKLAGKDPSPDAVQEYITTVRDLEFLVSQSLAFEYMVHGAHRAFHGLYLDLQQTLQPKPSAATMHELLAPGRANVQNARLTDAELIYTPSQIALACLRAASEKGAELVRLYVETKVKRAREAKSAEREKRNAWRAAERQRLERRGVKGESLPAALRSGREETEDKADVAASGLGMPWDALEQIFSEIADMIARKAEAGAGDVEHVKEIDKKLKQCQNPERMPNSRLAHHRAQEKQSAVLGKRDAAALHREGNGGAKGGLDANPFVDASAAAAALDGANDGEQDAAARDAKRARTTKAA